jgi:ketosteroid isomerase-like protein
MAAEDEVRDASTKFYAALNSMTDGSAAPMTKIWSHGPVTALHPIGGRQVGWDEVRGSFEQVAGLATGGHIELRDQRIQALGDDGAYEVGVEYGQAKLAGENIAIEQRVTNIYRREPDGWKVVHHHTDISPAMVDMLSRLRAA